jgi:hypothetical protein
VKNLLASMIKGIEAQGQICDMVVVGSDIKAEEVLKALQELGRDMHVIADNEISPKRIWVTSEAAIAQMPGGCRN